MSSYSDAYALVRALDNLHKAAALISEVRIGNGARLSSTEVLDSIDHYTKQLALIQESCKRADGIRFIS